MPVVAYGIMLSMTWWQGAVLGIIQGVTEFLPVSSSGHLALFSSVFGLIESSVFFTVLVHLATLLAIVSFFRAKLWQVSWQRLIFIGVGTIPVLVVGLLVKDYIDAIFSSLLVVAGSLLLSAIANFVGQWLLQRKSDVKPLNFSRSLAVGIGQSLAILPGLTRSGSTVATGLATGLDREDAFLFSFQLAVPAILATTVYETLSFLNEPIRVYWLPYFLGFVLAFGVGYASLVLLRSLILRSKLHYFGWYCLGLSAVTALLHFGL